jgi:hypothetical protein
MQIFKERFWRVKEKQQITQFKFASVLLKIGLGINRGLSVTKFWTLFSILACRDILSCLCLHVERRNILLAQFLRTEKKHVSNH